MKTYELTLIVDAQLSPERQEEEIIKFLDLLKSLGAEILNVEKWGKKKLAYPIEDRQYGYYLMSQFKANTDVLTEIERYLRLSPNIFRYLILHRDPHTLKLMELESERLAREVIYSAEKERVQTSIPAEDKSESPKENEVIEGKDIGVDQGEGEIGPAEKE